MGILRIGLFKQVLLGKWLWCFGKEVTHLWLQVIATIYGEGSGGGALELLEGHMAVGCGGRELEKMQIVSLVMWWREMVVAFNSSMTLRTVLLL